MTTHLGEIFSFVPLRPFEDTTYRGIAKTPVREFRIMKDGGPACVFVIDLIRREEKSIWEAARDAIGAALRMAEAALRGSYELELLSINLKEGVGSFKPANMAALLVNHGRVMSDGEERLIRYTSGFFRFRKLIPADWGKIRFTQQIQSFPGPPEKLDLLLKKLLSPALAPENPHPSFLILNDLSSTPLYIKDHETQKVRLGKLFEKIGEDEKQKIRACFYVNGPDSEVLGL